MLYASRPASMAALIIFTYLAPEKRSCFEHTAAVFDFASSRCDRPVELQNAHVEIYLPPYIGARKMIDMRSLILARATSRQNAHTEGIILHWLGQHDQSARYYARFFISLKHFAFHFSLLSSDEKRVEPRKPCQMRNAGFSPFILRHRRFILILLATAFLAISCSA